MKSLYDWVLSILKNLGAVGAGVASVGKRLDDTNQKLDAISLKITADGNAVVEALTDQKERLVDLSARLKETELGVGSILAEITSSTPEPKLKAVDFYMAARSIDLSSGETSSAPLTITSIIQDHKETIMLQPHITQGVRVKFTPRDVEGDPAQVDGEVMLTSSNDARTVVEREDSSTFLVKHVPGSGLGSDVLTVSADADLGEGVQLISKTFDLQWLGGPAVDFAADFTVVDLPPAA
jgi:hypothetical protein